MSNPKGINQYTGRGRSKAQPYVNAPGNRGITGIVGVKGAGLKLTAAQKVKIINLQRANRAKRESGRR